MKRILVIEDTNLIRNETCRILEYEGFETIAAENGEIGVRKAKEHHPDLILCDIMMPVMDGYGVISELRKNPETATIPFIYLTAMVSKENIREGMKKGADDYLTKPFTVEELITTVNTRLSKQEAIDTQTRAKVDELRNQIGNAFPHEFKTPLTSILGYSDFVITYIDELSKSEIKEQVELIYKAGKRLFRTIENFLAYSEVCLAEKDSDRLYRWLKSYTQFPGTLMETISVEIARRYGREGDLKVIRRKEDDLKLKIPEENLKKVMEEIVDNAFKFSQSGQVQVIGKKLSERKFQIRIEDSGDGLTAEQIKNIGAYNQFGRDVHEQQGSGLGLVIAQKMVNLQGGIFSITSEPDKGLKVDITLFIV